MRTLKRSECAILHLGLTRKWYDMIDSGVKHIEFREAKPYWVTRIQNWNRRARGKTPVLEFKRGYGRVSPRMWFVAGDGDGVIYDLMAASSPVRHRDLGEFPEARYCLFIGERVKLTGGAE